MRGMEGPLEILIAGVGIGVLFGGCAGYRLAGGSDGDAPMDKANHECEVAWVDANDGDPGTEPGGIITEPWCVTHVNAKRIEQVQKDAPDMEAQP